MGLNLLGIAAKVGLVVWVSLFHLAELAGKLVLSTGFVLTAEPLPLPLALGVATDQGDGEGGVGGITLIDGVSPVRIGIPLESKGSNSTG